MTARALDGILVADLSRVLAGPYCTMLLGDLGATVIKVEGPDGDDTRHWVNPARADGTSTYYLAINRNKRSVVLDLREPEDLADAHELTTRADVVVQNFMPGRLAGFGLDYASVAARNPRVVYASISGFGTTGGAALPGYDLIVQAMSGLMSLTGEADGQPYRSGVSIFDVIAGLHTAVGILAALHHREMTGEGQLIEANLMASALSGMVNQTSAYVAAGATPHRMGNAHPSLWPYELFPTADVDLIVAAGNDGQFRRLCVALDVPELAADPRYARNVDRTARRAEIRPRIVQRLSTQPARHWFETLNAAGVPCGPVNSVAEGIAYAASLGLEPVVEVGPDAVPGVRHPLDFSRTPAAYDLEPPALGADTETVKAWLRG